jgi:small subunit ribosomal protein S8
MLTDPIADMLTRLRNGNMALHDAVPMPTSKLKVRLAEVLEREGYIAGFEVVEAKPCNQLVVRLKYDHQRRRVISGIKRYGCRCDFDLAGPSHRSGSAP